MNIPHSHPYWIFNEVAKSNVNISNFCMSRYIYTPNTINDDRIALAIPRSQMLNENFIENILSNLLPEENVAIHSNIYMNNGETVHLPMVDMHTGSKAHLEKINSVLPHVLRNEIKWYSSGRSFHGYGKTLINHDEWVKLMGRLLLCNQKSMTPTVDPRWIGHRLIAGYASLRWTKNGEHYLAMPAQLQLPH